jgi:hypothetical protein
LAKCVLEAKNIGSISSFNRGLVSGRLMDLHYL